MIIFDKKKYVKSIIKNGINENDSSAIGKIFLVAKFLIQETTYKKGYIIKKLKDITSSYFCGLSDNLIDMQIHSIYKKANQSSVIEEESEGTDEIDNEMNPIEIEDSLKRKDAKDYFKPKKLTLYESELERIANLDSSLQELAFAFLVVSKFIGYKWIYECNSDIFKICHIDKQKSGKTKNKMINSLVNEGILRFYCNVNYGYKFNKSWIANTSFQVLIDADHFSEDKKITEKVWMYITNYDDVMLYWRLFNNDESVKTCITCGAPIEITNNSKRFCGDCSESNTKECKQNYKKNSNKAS